MTIKKIINKLLGTVLLERQVINKQQLDEALRIQQEKGGLIGEILVDLGYAKETDIAQALTAQYGFPFLPLENYEIDPKTIQLISVDLAKKYMVIPVDKLNNNLSMAMVNPLDGEAIEKVEQHTSLKVQAFVSTSSDIRKAIDKYYKKITSGDKP